MIVIVFAIQFLLFKESFVNSDYITISRPISGYIAFTDSTLWFNIDGTVTEYEVISIWHSTDRYIVSFRSHDDQLRGVLSATAVIVTVDFIAVDLPPPGNHLTIRYRVRATNLVKKIGY